jgi:hypothetical protein
MVSIAPQGCAAIGREGQGVGRTADAPCRQRSLTTCAFQSVWKSTSLRAARPAYRHWAIAPKPATPKRVVPRITRDGPQRHERPLRPSSTQEGVAVESCGTTLREAAEVLWPPGTIAITFVGDRLSPAIWNVKLFSRSACAHTSVHYNHKSSVVASVGYGGVICTHVFQS